MKRVLIVGAGGIGGRHIRGFLKTGRVELSICEPHDERRSAALKSYEITSAWADICEVPLDQFDAAVISAPAHSHIPIAQKLTDARLPFLTEKPLSVSLDGVDELIEAVNKGNLPVRVGYVNRLRPWIRAAHAHVVEGSIGDVRLAYANVSQDFRKYRPDYASIYYARKAMGGGAILDCATHVVDLLLWFMGPVSEVFAMYDQLVFENVECEDTALICLRFASGAMAQINVNQFQKPNVAQIEFVASQANLSIDNGTGTLSIVSDDSGDERCETFIDDNRTPLEIHESMFAVQADMFLDVVDGQADHLATLEEARDNLRVCLAAKRSYQERVMAKL